MRLGVPKDMTTPMKGGTIDGQCTRINKADVLAALVASLHVPRSPDDERRQQLVGTRHLSACATFL